MLRASHISPISLLVTRTCCFSSSTVPQLDRHRRKLLYQAKQRGMKENCILVGGFAEKHLSEMDDSEISQFEKLLSEIDPELNEWICDVRPFPSHLDGSVAQKMKTYANSNPLNYTFVPHKE